MTKDTLPIHVNPLRYAENASALHGRLPLNNMPMLCKSLSADTGDVHVDLKFGVDREGFKYVQGHVEAQVDLQCQRCLAIFQYQIESEFLSGFVKNEAAAKELPDRYDPYMVVDNELIIKDLIEEELILSLPIVPMHDPKQCDKTLPLIVAEDPSQTAFTKESPFKVIESLKRRKE